MNQSCWNIWPDRGFLCSPDPLTTLVNAPLPASTIATIEGLAAEIPSLLNNGNARAVMDTFPLLDLADLAHTDDFRFIERARLIYAYAASAYVHMDIHNPAHRLPTGIAVPLVQLSEWVDRPPILDYANYVLGNWERIDPRGDIVVDNLRLTQQFRDHNDEAWFILIHVDIEARAAGALQGIRDAAHAAHRNDAAAAERALSNVAESVAAMIRTFDRMPEHCDSDVYYYKVRPYIFMFQDVIYTGVERFNGQPQSFRGQTGAQSSIVPALVEALGLQHEQSGLTHHLQVMRDYMPTPHREFLAEMHGSPIRAYVEANRHNSALCEVYNTCLRQVLAFRQMHYHYAHTYIAQKVENPLGTGGTIFMDWLDQLVHETEAQLV